LEKQFLEVERINEYLNKEELKKKILVMSNKETKERGVSRQTFWRIKKRVKEGKRINWKTKEIRKLIR